MRPFLAAAIAVAFVAGGAGGLILAGRSDTGTSWYPWPSRSAAGRLLAIGAIAAALAGVAWIYATTT